MSQLLVHKNIDNFFAAGVDSATSARARELISTNRDARLYFYSSAPTEWFGWLSDKNLLDAVKEASADADEYRYRTPEMDYIVRVSEKAPAKTVDFLLSFNVAESKNLETIDRSLWLSTKLPADQIARIAIKIRNENWVQILDGLHHWAFGFKEMFERLETVQDYATIVTLAETVLSVRTKETVQKTAYGSTSNPFYFTDIHYSEVFEYLASVGDEYKERALAIATKALSQVIALGEKEDEVFSIGETFPLYDVDFFSLKLPTDRHYSFRDDVKDLASLTKNLVESLVGNSCDDVEKVNRIHEKYIAPLPDARSMWRLRLYVWTRCPEVFNTELKKAFFKIFEHENPWPVTSGAEYEHALKIAFYTLSVDDQKLYIDSIFRRFESEERPSYAYGILSSIFEYLSEPQKAAAKTKFGFDLKEDYSPQPSISQSMAGTVVPQTPADAPDIFNGTAAEIVEVLKTEWAPENLHKNYKQEDYLRPINGEGVGSSLEEKVKERLSEFLADAPLFFDRANLDANYTYSYLRGLYEAIRSDYIAAQTLDWSPFIEMGKAIAASGKDEVFVHKNRREEFDSWLSGWRDVHSAMADVMEQLFRDDSTGKPVVNFDVHRKDLYEIVDYLLTFPNPEPEDEKLETATMKERAPGEKEYQVSDPHTMAINSVRGRAFLAFLQFVFQDSKQFAKDDTSRLSVYVKETYLRVLEQEETQAIMFMFGHHLAFFYYRDRAWIRERFPTMFPAQADRSHLHLAAWEGYLSASLYREIFDELQNVYQRAINFDTTQYPKRNYRADLNEGLATHIALAYLHFEDFTLESDLYVQFWSVDNAKRHEAFISFVGRHVISRDNPTAWLKENEEVKGSKMLELWDWILENVKSKPVFEAFGFWINTRGRVFDPAELAKYTKLTLEKSDGKIDWEYGLIEALPEFAEKAPVETIDIIRLYFTPLDISVQARGFMHVDSDLVEIIRKLYKNFETKDAAYKLVDDLLPLGNGGYWRLKEALR